MRGLLYAVTIFGRPTSAYSTMRATTRELKNFLTSSMQTNNTHAASTVHVVQGSPPTTGSSPPDDKDYQIQQCRESFMNWSPAADGPLDFDAMATAGWYYIGDGHVKSYCCGINMGWKVTDDPWTQHALHGPECSFLKQQKGQSYIDRVQAAAVPSNEGGEPAELEQPDFPMSPQDEAEIEELMEEIKFLKKEKNCWICEEEARMVAYMPCGHLACCRICDLAQLKCPICKGPIEHRINVYLS
ncbi:E3 ubiquitin-protein ligase XIAP-like [Mizuhopecten yessoensis]|uniref:E3 ubiquitin-protein ligase XIAP-like n=1 Tax=Mizuhopecten yessoensis TaxID=6573 RepID=UPI000B457B6C|nr:E3 ubiquitin-protein ligase XIAP-like [Mizuhopecten yessoensis]